MSVDFISTSVDGVSLERPVLDDEPFFASPLVEDVALLVVAEPAEDFDDFLPPLVEDDDECLPEETETFIIPSDSEDDSSLELDSLECSTFISDTTL